ncbi:MAG TPA: hypothetical protein VEV84_07320, partial [Pyrinomonadaceae bacterium]|nr:hypothetical protein [Pyrinomonadaceae bacterium]
TPDDIVAPGTLSPREESLLDAIFFFARDVANNRTAADLTVPAAFTGGPSDTPVSDKMIADFTAFAEKVSPGMTKSADFASENGFITERLKYYVALAAKGDVAANRVLLLSDPQLTRALNELPRARELELANLRRKSTPIH